MGMAPRLLSSTDMGEKDQCDFTKKFAFIWPICIYVSALTVSMLDVWGKPMTTDFFVQ
jgi:hypothetical protein